MYNSQYYTCEQIDERLLQGYLDDYNTQTGQSLTKAQFLTKLGSIFSKEGVIDNTATQIGYYECDTAAGTAAKTITVANYALFAGGSMKVKFANKNTANNATLNINSQGAKALYYQGERASATNSWDAEEVVEIYYDGTSYYANNVKGGSGSGVYDVSKEHPTSGPNSDGKFTLEYILNSSNVNELIPVNKRYPGMSIQFVSTSDNKYIQCRLKTQTFSINKEDWEEEEQIVYSGSDGDDSLSFVDGEGNCNLQIKGGHVKTKEFDSRDSATKTYVDTKVSADVNTAKNEVLSKVAEVDNLENDEESISFIDENDNCAMQVKDGHIKTKNFDSREIINADNPEDDNESLSFVDEEGNCIGQFKGGHIKTKNFDSRNVSKMKAFLSLTQDDLTISGTSSRNADDTINLTSSSANRALINNTLQNWHFTMSAKFRCSGGVSFVMGKDRPDYGAKVEVVKDSNGSYIKIYSVTSNGQGGYIVGLVHTTTLDFPLNENEDYSLIIKHDVEIRKWWTIELIGEFGEYFTENTKDLGLNDIQGYGRPYVYTDATSCLLKEYAFTIQRYYDVKDARIAVFGHSLVEADSLGPDRLKCFANLLAEAVGEKKCPNFGLGGLTCSQLVGMLNYCLPLTQYIEYGVIMIGGNDSGQTTEALIMYLQQMCVIMERFNIKPILCTEHPLMSIGGMSLNNITAMNAWIRQSGYLYCDMEQVFLDVDVETVPYSQITDSNVKTDLYLPDMMHPTVEGHLQMFKRFEMDCPYVF